MKKVGTLPNEYAYTTMITVYGKAGDYGKAVDLLEEMQVSGMEPTVVTYNAIITACARAGDGQRALDWLQQMKAALVPPDSVTYSQVFCCIFLLHFVFQVFIKNWHHPEAEHFYCGVIDTIIRSIVTVLWKIGYEWYNGIASMHRSNIQF